LGGWHYGKREGGLRGEKKREKIFKGNYSPALYRFILSAKESGVRGNGNKSVSTAVTSMIFEGFMTEMG